MGPLPNGEDTVGAGLRRVLTRSRELGLLGDGPLEVHLDNAALFAAALPRSPDDGAARTPRLLDLGSGGGVPGLVLAVARPDLEVVLLDSQRRRCEFLRGAAADLEIGERVRVAEGRAEELAHDPQLRGRFDVVTARSFGSPAVTSECAVGFLAGPGGRVLVSEPPGPVRDDRWPVAGLRVVGLRLGHRWAGPRGAVQELVVVEVPPTLPRRVGVPAKRPLF